MGEEGRITRAILVRPGTSFLAHFINGDQPKFIQNTLHVDEILDDKPEEAERISSTNSMSASGSLLKECSSKDSRSSKGSRWCSRLLTRRSSFGESPNSLNRLLHVIFARAYASGNCTTAGAKNSLRRR